MKTYTGTKTIHAKPMTRGAYNGYRGWDIPKDENPDEPGYLVEYTDGGKPNHKDHAGYISWSPADVFERSYRISDSHQARVANEKDDLDEKLVKLNTFLASVQSAQLPPKERDRMRRQAEAMTQYAAILGERIAAFRETQTITTGDVGDAAEVLGAQS